MCRLDVYLGYVVYFESVRFSHFSDLSFFPLFLCTKSIFIWEILHLQYNFLAFYAHLMCATVRSIQRDEIKRKKKHETKQLKTGIPWHKMLNHTYYTKLIWCARTNQPREFALIMVAFNCNANIILRYHAHTHTREPFSTRLPLSSLTRSLPCPITLSTFLSVLSISSVYIRINSAPITRMLTALLTIRLMYACVRANAAMRIYRLLCVRYKIAS